MKIEMKKLAALTLGAALCAGVVSAVTVRQDYFPLAVGNTWAYTQKPTIGEPLDVRMEYKVVGKNDSAYIVEEWLHHPLADIAGPQVFEVSSHDNGTISGLRTFEGLYRHTYYSNDTYLGDGKYDTLVSIDTFYLGNSNTLYTDVWEGTSNVPSIGFKGNTEVMAPGIGMIGFQMDLTTEEYPEVGHGGFQLDSATIVPKPAVTSAASSSLFAYSDSSFTATETGNSSFALNYSLSTGFQDWHIVTSSYNEITNTLRIWIADTLDWAIVNSSRMVEEAVTPGGYWGHTLNVDHVDLSSDLHIKIYYNRTNSGIIPLVVPGPLFEETVSFATSVIQSEQRAIPSSLLSVADQSLQISLPVTGEAELFIEDLRGRIVSKQSVRNGQSLSLKSLDISNGMYLVRLKSTAGVVSRKIYIK